MSLSRVIFNTSLLLFTLFILTSCSTIPNHSTKQRIVPTAIIKSPNDGREYASVTLDNQLQLILVSDPSIEKSAAALSVSVGSFQEPKGFGGLAHYLEHMLFMGTKDYPGAGDYADFVARNGGTQNAYTDLHYTNYMMAVNNSAFDEALARFSGFFHQALLDEKYADKERSAVDAEWMMKRPNDWVILEQLNGLTLNPAHPLSQFNWGNLRSLRDKGPRKLHTELVKLYQTYYSANLMKAVLISPLPIAQLKSLANKHFAKIPNKQTPKPMLQQDAILTEQLQKIIHYRPQTDMKQLQIKFVIDNNADQFLVKPNGYVIYMLANEMPGSLAAELRSAGLSESVYADFDGDKYGSAGDLTLYIDLTEFGVNNRDKVMAATLSYLSLLKEQGVDERYFHEIKQSFSNSFRFKEKVDDYSYAMDIAASMQSVPAEFVLSSQYQYQNFDPAAVQAVFDQLTIENARLFYIDPDQPTDTQMEHFPGQYSVSDISSDLKKRWQQGADEFDVKLPRVNNLMPSNFELVKKRYTSQPKHVWNKEGLSLHLAHSKLFNQPKGLLNIVFNSGLSKSSAKHHVMAHIVNYMLERDFTALQSEAFTAGINLDLQIKNGLQISISGFDDKQSVLLQHMARQLNGLTLTEQQLDNYKQALVADINSRNKQMLLDQLFFKFRQVLNLDNYSDGALLNALPEISRQDIANFITQLFNQANIQILAYGNYEEDSLTEMINGFLAELPSNHQPSRFYLSPEFNAPQGQSHSWLQDLEMTDVAFANTYLRPLKLNDLAVATVLQQIISTPLFEQIRTEEQLGYSVGFFSQRVNQQLLLGFYIQSSVKGLDQVNQRIKGFRYNFSHTLNQLSEAEFNGYKDALLVTLRQSANNLEEEFIPYFEDWQQQNWQFSSEQTLIEKVGKVSLLQVQDMFDAIHTGRSFGQFIVQLRGAKFRHLAPIQPQGVVNIRDIDEFHKRYLFEGHQ